VGLGSTQFGIAKNRYDWVIVDEAARATPTELAVAIQAGARVLLVGDHRQLPPLYTPEVVAHIVKTLRFHDRTTLTRSDFQRVFESQYGQEAGAMLQTQYRMAPAFGKLVSACFYPTPLTPGRGDAPAWFSMAAKRLAATITWLDRSSAGRASYERKNESFSLITNTKRMR
jgi:superfamily I DNA and/or RNA helicase